MYFRGRRFRGRWPRDHGNGRDPGLKESSARSQLAAISLLFMDFNDSPDSFFPGLSEVGSLFGSLWLPDADEILRLRKPLL